MRFMDIGNRATIMKKINLLIVLFLLPFGFSCSSTAYSSSNSYSSEKGDHKLVFHANGEAQLIQFTDLKLKIDLGSWTRNGDMVELFALDEVLRFRVNNDGAITTLELTNRNMCPQTVNIWKIADRYTANSGKH